MSLPSSVARGVTVSIPGGVGRSPSSGPEAPLAVAVDVRGDRRERLLRLVEGALGWTVVDPEDPLLPPRAVLVDATAVPATRDGSAGDGARAGVAWPRVLLVGDDDDPGAVARAATSATVVLDWPPTPEALRVAVRTPVAAPGPGPLCTVTATAGGVGATSVALGIAGIVAWRAGRTLAAVSGPSHLSGTPVVTVGDLASPAAWPAAAPVAGLPALRVVQLVDTATGAAAPVGEQSSPVPVGAVPTVVDLGVAATGTCCDVVVAAPDRAGVAGITASAARAVVLLGRGPAGPAAVAAAADGRPVVALRRDPRVARACHAGRHPADAPRSWLAGLDELLSLLGPSLASLPVPPTSAPRRSGGRAGEAQPPAAAVHAPVLAEGPGTTAVAR